MNYITNEEDELRLSMLHYNGEAIDSTYRFGGISLFNDMTPEEYENLLEAGFIDSDDAQNEAPTFKEMYDFCVSHPGFTMHGYVVSPERNDCRITCEGLEMIHPNDFYEKDFSCFSRAADDCEFSTDRAYSWYD